MSAQRHDRHYRCWRCLKIAGPFHGWTLRLEANLVVRPLEPPLSLPRLVRLMECESEGKAASPNLFTSLFYPLLPLFHNSQTGDLNTKGPCYVGL